MKQVTAWLKEHHADLLRGLTDLVAVPSISNDGEHQKEIEQSASLVCEQMRQAGLNNVEILRCGDSNPYAYGEWLGAPGKPTVFLYAHHDVQPVATSEEDAAKWKSDPWTLTPRDGRLYGRGSADDKGAISAQLGAIAAFLKTTGALPVNVKMVVEGEEEVGSTNLLPFFKQYQEKIRSDVIVVCDTENIEAGKPAITYSLRGIVAVQVEARNAEDAIHSGTAGGALADPVLALNVILSRLYWGNKKVPIPGFYEKVRTLTPSERRAFKKLPDAAVWGSHHGLAAEAKFALPKGATVYEATCRLPAVTVIAQEANSIKNASNQVRPKAEAIVSCRIVPDMEPEEVLRQLTEFLSKDPPWGVKVTVTPNGPPVKWWMTDPTGPAFDAARKAMKSAYGEKAAEIGCGGSIGFVGPLAELFGGAPALLLGIEDPLSAAHAPNESLHEGDFLKLTATIAHLFENIGNLPEGKVK